MDGEPQAAVTSSLSHGAAAVIEDDSSNKPSPAKRARIEIVVPSAAGVLAGAVAGSLITWAGLAYY